MPKVTELRVNGVTHQINADGDATLLSVLREQLALTGTKYGCGEGQCGACTVLIDGLPRRSCRTPVASVGAKEIATIEGLEHNGQLHPLQQAFLDAGALQCGYCTSGMILTATALLKSNPDPSAADVARFLEGNICRCGTYPRIIAAVRRAAQAMKGAAR